MSGTSCLYVPKAQAEAIARERDSLREQVRICREALDTILTECEPFDGADVGAPTGHAVKKARAALAATVRAVNNFERLVRELRNLVQAVDNDLLPKWDFPGVPSAVARAKNLLAEVDHAQV